MLYEPGLGTLPFERDRLASVIMQEGVVKFFNEAKGFGFIIPNSGESEIFVHVSGLVDKVRENDHVSYEVQQGRKGLNAVNVKLI
jgi:CspA family cold shock protein